MVTWVTLSKDGSPVTGDPEQFEVLDSIFTTIERRITQLNVDFLNIRCGRSQDFAGAAADAFDSRLKEISQAVNDVPTIATDLKHIFSNHSHELRALQRAADSALARAQTRWNRKEAAESDKRTHENQLWAIDRQLDQLGGSGLGGDAIAYGKSIVTGDDSEKAERQRLKERRQTINWNLEDAKSDLKRAEEDLDDSRRDWDEIHNDEADLNDRTRQKLDKVELWSLSDPNKIKQAAEALGDFFTGLVEGIKNIVEYLGSDEFLQRLYEALGPILEVLSYVQMACFVLSLLPIPGLQALAALGLALEVLSIALSGIKMAVGMELFDRGKISASELTANIVDFAGQVLPGPPIGRMAKAGAKAAKKVSRKVDDVAQRSGRVLTDFSDSADEFGDKVKRKIIRESDEFADEISKKSDDWWRPPASGSVRVAGRVAGEAADGAIEAAGDVAGVTGNALKLTGNVQRAIVETGAGSVELLMDSDLGQDVEDEIWEVLRNEVGDRVIEPALKSYEQPCESGKQPVLASCNLGD